jgi:hypothetical protein
VLADLAAVTTSLAAVLPGAMAAYRARGADAAPLTAVSESEWLETASAGFIVAIVAHDLPLRLDYKCRKSVCRPFVLWLHYYKMVSIGKRAAFL